MSNINSIVSVNTEVTISGYTLSKIQLQAVEWLRCSIKEADKLLEEFNAPYLAALDNGITLDMEVEDLDYLYDLQLDKWTSTYELVQSLDRLLAIKEGSTQGSYMLDVAESVASSTLSDDYDLDGLDSWDSSMSYLDACTSATEVLSRMVSDYENLLAGIPIDDPF